MNTGERLVQLSGLPSGTALAHFAAITQTGGTGAGSLIVAHSMTVLGEQRRTSIFEVPSVSAVESGEKVQGINSADAEDACIFTRVNSAAVKTSQGSVSVLSVSEGAVANSQPNSLIVSTFLN